MAAADLPPARDTPCTECPWRRISAPGWLGPYTAEQWFRLAHSDEPIACHLTIVTDGEWEDGTMQCAGAARYRANVAKQPRDPQVASGPVDRDTVFARPDEFLAHHTKGPTR